jgi:hypothetical protein
MVEAPAGGPVYESWMDPSGRYLYTAAEEVVVFDLEDSASPQKSRVITPGSFFQLVLLLRLDSHRLDFQALLEVWLLILIESWFMLRMEQAASKLLTFQFQPLHP